MNLPPLGARWDRETGQVTFSVWASHHQTARLHVVSPQEQTIEMARSDSGYFSATLHEGGEQAKYFYSFDNGPDRPDPASRYQPDGPHGASQVVADTFPWTDKRWRGKKLENYVFYELHVGTFTAEGTFDAAIARLPELVELGITSVEIMPIAQFPGDRNWGYDGTFPFAAQNSYGGPQALKRFVNAAHTAGLCVTLDVVYNHLGPEGNYLWGIAPYFTDKYQTPWGSAINFDDKENQHVRHYFIENALYWLEECHIDSLRLDAIHAIFDFSAYPFLLELAVKVHERAKALGRKIYLIAESDLNDARVLRSYAEGGLNLDATWSDDFHHALHTLLTEEKSGYYSDFGQLKDLAKAYQKSFVYDGCYSQFRHRPHGNSPEGLLSHRFVVAAQNHDQVGNRMLGERLGSLIEPSALYLSAASTILSPYLPLLFQGEEYGERNPFLYFTSHSDPALIEGVRQGRKKEFETFAWRGEVPNPQDKATFLNSKLNWDLRHDPTHKKIFTFYKMLLQTRCQMHKELGPHALTQVTVWEEGKTLFVQRVNPKTNISWMQILCFSKKPVDGIFDGIAGGWQKIFSSYDINWIGPQTHLPGTITPAALKDYRWLLYPHETALYKSN